MGFYLLFFGIVIFKNVIIVKEVVWKCLFDCMLVEMDLFYLVLMFYCGKLNEFVYVCYVVEEIVCLCLILLEIVIVMMIDNFFILFKYVSWLGKL